jgi:hypothetical protein
MCPHHPCRTFVPSQPAQLALCLRRDQIEHTIRSIIPPTIHHSINPPFHSIVTLFAQHSVSTSLPSPSTPATHPANKTAPTFPAACPSVIGTAKDTQYFPNIAWTICAVGCSIAVRVLFIFAVNTVCAFPGASTVCSTLL